MSIKLNLGAWSSVFAVPSKVVDEGLKFADGVKLKVLLYILRNAEKEMDVNSIAEATGVSATDIPEALDYWVSMDIVQKEENLFSPTNNSFEELNLFDNSKKENNAKIEEEESEEPALQKQHFAVTKPQKPDYFFTVQRLAKDEELKFLVNETQTALGKVLSNSDISTLLMLKDTCGLPSDVILMLIHYTVSIDKGNMRAIEKLGVAWANDGVNSVDAADNKIRLATQRSKCYTIVASAFGLKNAGSPTKKQLDYCSTWVTEWKFSPEMLREAYERCVDTKGEMKFNYIDGILKRWQKSGIKNMNDLTESEKQKANQEKAGKKNTSYDINELDKFETLDFIE